MSPVKICPNRREVVDALNTICIHRLFSRAPLMRAFLNYVVMETLAGRGEKIIAYSIAVDALGKPTSFDAQRDPSVRVLAKRLRDSLDEYYDEESDHPLHIIMQPGSYVPSFVYTSQPRRANLQSEKPPGMLLKPAETLQQNWTKPVVVYKD